MAFAERLTMTGLDSNHRDATQIGCNTWSFKSRVYYLYKHRFGGPDWESLCW